MSPHAVTCQEKFKLPVFSSEKYLDLNNSNATCQTVLLWSKVKVRV